MGCAKFITQSLLDSAEVKFLWCDICELVYSLVLKSKVPGQSVPVPVLLATPGAGIGLGGGEEGGHLVHHMRQQVVFDMPDHFTTPAFRKYFVTPWALLSVKTFDTCGFLFLVSRVFFGCSLVDIF